MVRVTYIEAKGAQHTVDVPEGRSVMEGAIENDIAGIVAECRGACACATCHVHVGDAWIDRTGEKSVMEEAMLQLVDDFRPVSRLSCQIRVTAALDGLSVRIPETQLVT